MFLDKVQSSKLQHLLLPPSSSTRFQSSRARYIINLDYMALRSAGSQNGQQPAHLSDSQRHRRSEGEDYPRAKEDIGILMVFVTIAVAVTFAMGFTCIKLYMSSAPDSGITGLVKKAVFMVFLFCNSIPMLTSVLAVMHVIWAYHLTDFEPIQTALIRAMALVTIAFMSILVAFIVGVWLVVILLPWHTYFT